MHHSTRILLGLVLGLTLGLILAINPQLNSLGFENYIAPIGTLWVNAIRMTVIPLLMALLITAIAGGDVGDRIVELGSKTIAVIGGMILLSCSFAVLFAAPLILNLDVDSNSTSNLIDANASTLPANGELPPFSDWLVSLIPSNPVAAAAAGDMLPLMIFTGLFGAALLQVSRTNREPVLNFFISLKETMFVLIHWVMLLAPLGVFALVLPLVVALGVQAISALASFLFITCSLILLLATSLFVIVHFLGLNVIQFARTLAPVQVIGFSTRSSLAALPVTLNATVALGVSEKTAGVVLPIAVTLFKFASPLARTSGTYFVALLYGIDLAPYQIIIIALSIGLLSFYSPGIPSGGLLVMTPIYVSLGLPVAGIGILIAVDLVIDMFITAANVTANATLALLAERFTQSRTS